MYEQPVVAIKAEPSNASLSKWVVSLHKIGHSQRYLKNAVTSRRPSSEDIKARVEILEIRLETGNCDHGLNSLVARNRS
jgi:hypothetical protein